MTAVDEAFAPLAAMLPHLLPALPDLVDTEAGVRSHITGYEVSTPIELTIAVGPAGVEIGSTPPLYHVATSFLPVFHAISIVAVREDAE